ncbi:MAG: efflux RND transporter periplasmic adaptor subunit [Pseudomonadota bacterium]
MRPAAILMAAAGLFLVAAARAEAPPEARAMLAPQAEAVLASELAARIEAIPFQNGERFKKGDTLVAFDCAAFRAALAEARAALKGAEHTLDNARKLASLKSAGQLELDLAEAEVERARARLQAAAVPVERCVIRAPYGGRVVERKAQPHESMSPGQPLLAVLDDSRIEVRLLAPSAWLRWLKPGTPFTLKVDETGLSYPGKVARLGARVDAVSQSIAVVGMLDGPGDGIIAGMSGSAVFRAATGP